MSTATATRRAQEIALEAIETGANVREHVAALGRSMALRRLIVPINVHPLEGDEPVDLWAIPKQLGRHDATKIDVFWEASPDAAQKR